MIVNLESQLEDIKDANRSLKKERAALLELNQLLETRCSNYGYIPKTDSESTEEK